MIEESVVVLVEAANHSLALSRAGDELNVDHRHHANCAESILWGRQVVGRLDANRKQMMRIYQ